MTGRVLALLVLAFIATLVTAGNQPTATIESTGSIKTLQDESSVVSVVKKVAKKIFKVKDGNGNTVKVAMELETETKNVTKLNNLPTFSYGAPTFLGPHNQDVSKKKITFVDEADQKTYISCQVDCYSSFLLNNETSFLFNLNNPYSFRFYSYWALASQGCFPADKVNNVQRKLIIDACETFGNNTKTIEKFNAKEMKTAFATIQGLNSYGRRSQHLPNAYALSAEARPKFDSHWQKHGSRNLFTMCRTVVRAVGQVGANVVRIVRRTVRGISHAIKSLLKGKRPNGVTVLKKTKTVSSSKKVSTTKNSQKPTAAKKTVKKVTVNKKVTTVSNGKKPTSVKKTTVKRTTNKVVKPVKNASKPQSKAKTTLKPKKKQVVAEK